MGRFRILSAICSLFPVSEMNRVRPFFLYSAVLVLVVTGSSLVASRGTWMGWHTGSAFGDYYLAVVVGDGRLGLIRSGPYADLEELGATDGFWTKSIDPSERDVWPLGEFEFDRGMTDSDGFAGGIEYSFLTVPIWLAGLLLSGVLLACGAVGRRRLPVEE